MASCSDQQALVGDNTSQEPTLHEEDSPPAIQTQLSPCYINHSNFMESKVITALMRVIPFIETEG
jgi:hypothetical protein